jgi:arylsulfatase A-like enzyme
MKYFYFLLITFAITGLISCQMVADERPNFIIIFTDDQGYADLGCYGAKGFSTPNLDQMADEGMRFTNFYVAASVCSPSRAALLTGSYPARVGVPSVLHPVSPTGLDPSEITIAEILKEQGYATACAGKWHVGDHPSMMPTNQGFDEYFGIPYSNDMWPWRNDYLKKKAPSDLFPDLPLYKNEEVIERNPDQNQLTTRYTEYALRFIEENKNKPFFLYLPHTMPHIPLGVSEKFAGKTPYGRYEDVIEEIYWSVGEILKTLKSYNLDEKMLVIFTSDNGPWLTYGTHAGKAFPLREGKGTTFEGGQRVPCIMHWPGKIPAGKISKELVTAMDFLPTLTGLAGGDVPADRVIDGKNIWPIMQGNDSAKSPYKALFYHQPSGLQAVRSGPWKLHFPHMYRHQAGPGGIDGFPAGQVEESIGLSLFNLEDDIGETINIADQYPELVEELTALANAHLKDLTENARVPLEISDLSWRRYQDKLSEGKYFSDWWLIGPFDNTNRKGIEKAYPPELEYKTEESYPGINKKMVTWQAYDGKDNEYISLTKLFKPSQEAVIYARRVFNSVKDGEMKIGLGTNDGVKMWVNGELVHSNVVGRTAIPNDDVVTVPFKKGENVVLLKIDQIGGGWGFYFSVMKGQELLK